MNPSQTIDTYIKGITDWRGERMTQLRKLIHDADPEIVEEWKWDTPVFVHGKMVCALGVFQDHVKINFFQGAVLPDPKKLFNAGLEAKKTRAVDIFESDSWDEKALRELIKSAVNYTLK